MALLRYAADKKEPCDWAAKLGRKAFQWWRKPSKNSKGKTRPDILDKWKLTPAGKKRPWNSLGSEQKGERKKQMFPRTNR
jgi:hypothetical protein